MGKQQNQVIQQQSVVYSGPLPPSNEFSSYEKALPGAAERILSMAEKEAEHRRENENIIVQHSVRKSSLGQIFAFILALISMGLIFFSILKGELLGAIVPAITALSSLIAVFIGKKQS